MINQPNDLTEAASEELKTFLSQTETTLAPFRVWKECSERLENKRDTLCTVVSSLTENEFNGLPWRLRDILTEYRLNDIN